MLALRLLLLLLAAVPAPPAVALSRDELVNTTVGWLRGRLSAVIDGRLPRVMQFLGVPYAAPPVGSLRFMPPRTPSRRPDVRDATRPPPACPQPPAAADRHGRRRRPQHVQNQSEDCLYLNIYAPVTEGHQRSRHSGKAPLPVMVYIHGTSPSGEADSRYDGTVLASFGGVIVVTVNYRIGVLGFLKPAGVSNFALHDQRAALTWLQENISQFGGDPSNVTIMGHGTGAVCANLLAISPLVTRTEALFQRVILMSGSSLSPWAMAYDPVKVTIAVAKALNCYMKTAKQLQECLRSKTVDELIAADFQWPMFSPSLAPSEDGIIVPEWFRDPAALENQLSQFDMLYGVSSQESFHVLSQDQLGLGISRATRDRLLASFLRSGYRQHTQQLLEMVANRYLDNPMNVMKYRDKMLEILSDAKVVAPVVRLADIHSKSVRSSYMYVFSHVTSNGGNRRFGSITGDELPYVFGAPFAANADSAPVYYTQKEKTLSEFMMTAWTNFAKTGDPNLPRQQGGGFISEPNSNSSFYNVLWRRYDSQNRPYLDLAARPRELSHYRSNEMPFWNRVVPQVLSDAPPIYEDPAVEDYDEPPGAIVPPAPSGHLFPPPPLAPSTPPPRQYPRTLPPQPNHELSPSLTNGKPHNDAGGGAEEVAPAAANGMLSIVIVVGVCFVLLNLLILGGVYYQKQRLKVRERRLERQSSLSEGGSRSASVRSSRESVARSRVLARSASGDDLVSPASSTAVTPAVSRESVARVTISEGNAVYSPRRVSEGSVASRRTAEGGVRDASETDGHARRRDHDRDRDRNWDCERDDDRDRERDRERERERNRGKERERQGRATMVVKERSLDQRMPRGKESMEDGCRGSNPTRGGTLGRERGASRGTGEPASRSGSVRSKSSHVSGTLPRTKPSSNHNVPRSQSSGSLKRGSKPTEKSPQTKKKGITLSEKSFAQDILHKMMPKAHAKQPTKRASPPRDRPPRGILKTRTPASPASDSSGIYSEMVPALHGSVSGLSTGSGCRVVYRTDSTCQVDFPVEPDDEDPAAVDDDDERGKRDTRGEPDSASVGSARSLQLSRSSSVGGRSSSSIHFVPRAAALPPPPPKPSFPTIRFEQGVAEDCDDVLTALRHRPQRPEAPGHRRSIAGLPPINGGEVPEPARTMSLQRGGGGGSGARRGRQKPPPPPRTSSRPEGLYAARDVTCPHGYPVHPPPPGPDPLERFVPGQAESPDPSAAATADGPSFAAGQRGGDGPTATAAGAPRVEETVTFQLQQPPARRGTQF